MNILVLGIGQSLRGDDGAGPEAARRWQAQYPQTAKQVRVEIAELPGLSLLDLLEGMEAAVIVDAVQASSPAGSLVRLGPDDLLAFTPDAGSAHGWGAAETLRLGRSLSPAMANCRVTLIGIVAAQFELGAGLSPEVRGGLAGAVESIQQEVDALLGSRITPS
jgi:hydrogenase maturation protease